MSKRMYAGVGDVARKVKKVYIGANDVARKVKKGYIGVGGIARPFLSGEVARYGEITPLSIARWGICVANVGNTFQLFMGGRFNGPTTTVMYSNVDAYNKALVRQSAPALSLARHHIAGASVGDYAIGAGGITSADMMSRTGIVDTYNTALTRTNGPTLNSGAYCGASLPAHAVFAGNTNANVYAINASLTSTVLANVSVYGRSAGAAVGDYVLFAGGDNNNYSVDAYNSALVKSSATNLDSNTYSAVIRVASIGKDYAIFGCGFAAGGSASPSQGLSVYNKALVRTTLNMSIARKATFMISSDDFVIIAGGNASTGTFNWNYIDLVEGFDSSLVRATHAPLSKLRSNDDGPRSYRTIGDYALIAGDRTWVGTPGTSNWTETTTNLVEAYTV